MKNPDWTMILGVWRNGMQNAFYCTTLSLSLDVVCILEEQSQELLILLHQKAKITALI